MKVDEKFQATDLREFSGFPEQPQEEPSYYAVIPLYILEDKELSFAAKVLYGEITALTKKEGYCYATNKYLAQRIGSSENYVIEIVKELRNKNHIECDTQKNAEGTFRKIFLTLQPTRVNTIALTGVNTITPHIDNTNKIIYNNIVTKNKKQTR